MAAESLLLDLGILFGILALAGSLAHGLGQSVIPFYLAAGLLIDPSGNQILGRTLQIVEVNDFLSATAELGVVLLLFFLGLKFSVQSLVRGRARISKAGAIDLVNLAVGIGLGLAFGFSVVEALFLGGIVYVSSSAVITKALIDLDWIADPESETILGVLVFEDLFLALYIAILSALTLEGGTLVTALSHVGIALAGMIALTAVATYGARQLGNLLASATDEVALLRALAITVLVAGAALTVGLSEAVAAFFVGMAFGETPQAQRLGRLAAPLRDVFGAVFFFWIGLNAQISALTSGVGLLAALVVVTAIVKVVTGMAGGSIYGLAPNRRVRVGLGLVARGEFSLVIAALAVLVGGSAVMTELLPSLTVGYVLVTSVVGTLAMQHAGPLERWLAPLLSSEEDTGDPGATPPSGP